MQWQFENGIPIYLQIIDIIGIDIAKGKLKPGSKLPGVRTLALEAGVTPNTVQRALTALKEKGLVYAKRTSGRFVTNDERRIKELRQNRINQILNDFFHNMQEMGMSKGEIIAAVSKWQEKEME